MFTYPATPPIRNYTAFGVLACPFGASDLFVGAFDAAAVLVGADLDPILFFSAPIKVAL
jgi:hypothetical protein